MRDYYTHTEHDAGIFERMAHEGYPDDDMPTMSELSAEEDSLLEDAGFGDGWSGRDDIPIPDSELFGIIPPASELDIPF